MIFKSEELIAYELGYRYYPSTRFSVDLASFFNVYDNLRTCEMGGMFLENDPLPHHMILAACHGQQDGW